MTINNATVEQINVALLDIDKRIKALNIDSEAIKSLQNSVKNIKSSLNETQAGLQSGATYDINISGNASTATNANHAETATIAETATNANHAETAGTVDKVANALTVNGKTYDGSSAVDAGVQTVANGGTGVTTQAEINQAFVGELPEGTSDVTDGTMFVSSYATDNGFADTDAFNVPFKRKFLTVWNYIKGKISSVLGLTKDNYGGKASTAGTADIANNGTFGMLGGTKQAETNNFEDLLNNELCSNQTGGLRGGSIHIPAGQEANNLGIPVDTVDTWYNFLYIPHRTGIYSDDNMYGTLFVTPMLSNDGTLYIIHRISGHNYPAHRFNSAT